MSVFLGLLAAFAGLPLEDWDAAGEVPLQKGARTATERVAGFVWLDAEDFSDYGGWKMDTQFVHLMGSAYLIAPGLGAPVVDAKTAVQVRHGRAFSVWVRARDWLPAYHPGRFRVLVNGTPLERVLGQAVHDEWAWTCAGRTRLKTGKNTVALRDISGGFARCDALILTTDRDYVPPEESRAIEQERARLTGFSLKARHRGDFDVVVVGGGPAGCPAAIAAARLGAATALIQDRPVLGGNASLELGVGMEGAAISQRHARESGVVEEASRMRAYHGWRRISMAFHQLVEAEEDLTLALNTRVVGVAMDTPSRIATVKAVDTLTGAYSTFGARIVIDCTGDGWVGYYANADYRVGREARAEYNEPDAPATGDAITMSGCIMGRHGVGYRAEDTGAPTVYRAPAWAAKLPDLAACGRRPRNLHSGEWWMEHAGTWDDLYDAERARDELIRISFGYWDYLKNRWPERETLRNHELVYVPWIVAKRESRRLMGDHVLTANEVVAGTLFPDRISYGGWPVDIHNPKGIYEGETPYHTNYPIKKMYTIPYRCLYSRNIENLLFAGRCASFSHFGLGTVRVERTLATLGQAAGVAAGLCIRKGVSPRAVHEDHLAELQQTLLRHDQYIPELRNQDPYDLARTARVTASSEAHRLQFGPENVRLRALYHHMDHKRAFMMPVSGGNVGRATVYMRSEREEDVVLRLHLREARHTNDFSSTEDLGVAQATLPAGAEQWVTFDIDHDVRSSHAWLWLEPERGIHWRLMNKGLPGMQRAYAAKDANGAAAWQTPGGYYACYLDPPSTAEADCAPENVISGVARMTATRTHMWRSDPDLALPQWLELEFPEPVAFDTIHLTFVTDLDTRRLSSGELLSGVTAYELQIPGESGWEMLVRETGNYQRWRRHTFEPVVSSKLRIVIHDVAGMRSAALYEVRVYEQAGGDLESP